MKTFRFIGMALFAILMCVNLSSCSSSDDDPTEEPEEVIAKTKKLIEIKQTYSDGRKYYALFLYDEKNRLINIKTGYNSEEWSTDCTWGNNTIMFSGDTYYTKNGFVVEEKEEFNYNYDSSNQFISETEKEEYEGQRKWIYTWNNGNLVNKEFYHGNELNQTVQINYNDKTCKGHFPLMASIIFYDIDCSALYYDDFGLFIAHPELLGKTTKNLPNKITDSYGNIHSLEYTFTNDGYVESCTIESNKSNKKYTMIATFKWQ